MRKKIKRSDGSGLLQGIAMSLAIYILSLLGITAAMYFGVLAETMLLPGVISCCALSACAGGVLFRKRTSMRALQASLLPAGGFAALLLLAGMCWTGVEWAGEGGGLLLGAAVGGAAAAVIGGKQKRKRRRIS